MLSSPAALITLRKIRRGEGDRDLAAVRPGEAAVSHCRANTFARLLDGGIGKSDYRCVRLLWRANDVHLDIDDFTIEAHDRTAQDAGKHEADCGRNTWDGSIPAVRRFALRRGRRPLCRPFSS